MSESKPTIAIFVLWQSLVVGSYRSFFTRLLRYPCRLALAAPHQFTELGNQLLTCTPFEAPFSSQRPDSNSQAFILKAKSWHTQITWYKGLGRALRIFFHPSRQDARVFICMSEPYAFTALFAWLVARLTLRGDFYFVCCAMQNIYKKFPIPIRLVQWFLFKKSHAILVLGREHEKVLRRHGYQGTCWHFPLWFDANRFEPQTNSISVGPPTIGYAGGLTEAKGLLDFSAALRTLAKKYPQKVKLRIAGTGPLLNDMESLAQELRVLGWDAACLGPLPAEAMPEFFQSIDILVVPSRTLPNWKEQFGRVIVEAEASGATAIGSNSGEIPEVIGDPNRIFQEADSEALCEKLIQTLDLLKDPNQRVLQRSMISARAFKRYSDKNLSETFFKTLQRSV